MAGLMPQRPQDDPAQQPEQEPDAVEGSAGEEGEENASPGDQERYEDFIASCMSLIYKGGEVNPYILELLDDDHSDLEQIFGDALADADWQKDGPLIALAATAVVVVMSAMEQDKLDPNNEDDGAIIRAAGEEIVSDLADLSSKAGKRKYSDAEATRAYLMGVDLFREAASEKGLIDLSQAKQEFAQIADADKAGRLGDILPQLVGGESNELRGKAGAGAA